MTWIIIKNLFAMFIVIICCASNLELDQQILVGAFKQFLPNCREYNFELLHGGWSTAKNYKSIVDKQEYVARIIAGEPTKIKKEITAQRTVAEIGLAPYVYYYNDNLIIMDYIHGKTISIANGSDVEFIKNIGKALKKISKLHCSQVQEWDIFKQTHHKLEQLKQKQTPLSPLFDRAKKILFYLEQNIISENLPLMFCHGDLNPRNIFIINNKPILIDWSEACLFYEGIDIASFSVFLCLSHDADLCLLESNLQRTPTSKDIKYFKMLKLLIRAFDAANLFNAINDLIITHEKMASVRIQNFAYYETVFADDYINGSDDFTYMLAYSQLQELLIGIDLHKENIL